MNIGVLGHAADFPAFPARAALPALKSRQGVAHPGPAGGESGATYLAVSYGLRWMLRHCLLVDLGLSEERSAELVTANKRFGGKCELIKRWTTGS